MRVLFAAQSLKGTLEAVEIANMINERSGDIEAIPVTDGGDGFLDTIKFYKKKCRIIPVFTVNANNHRIKTNYLIDKNAAYIESANIVGLKRVRKSGNPFIRTSSGIAAVITHAEKSCKNIIIGLGGSATIDSGYGMLKGLGASVEAHKNTKILKNINSLESHHDITVIPDVYNPLNGSLGAVVYARQKGVNERQLSELEKYYNITADKLHILNKKYAGAAGGLGAAFMAINAGFEDNYRFMESLSNIGEKIRKADIVITCEGKLDKQSFYGKITGRIISEALKENKKMIVITGSSEIKHKKIDIYTMGKEGMINPKMKIISAINKIRKTL